jgi:transcriptional regulator with XRE-family HTH domain
MEKSIHTSDYAAVLRLLRSERRRARLTQLSLAEKLDLTQSQVSKIERGETRLDIIQLRSVCRAYGISLVDFARKLDRELG